MAKRPRYSRWRRLPKVYRSGEFKIPDPNPEPRRLTVYLDDSLLEAAEGQAALAGIPTVQEYCAGLLRAAIDAERVRLQVADFEARQGAFEGLDEIANDPEYLAEWSAQAQTQSPSQSQSQAREGPDGSGHPVVGPLPPRPEPASLQSPIDAEGPEARQRISAAARVVLHHAGQGGDDPQAFLPCLRRGESVSVAEVAELARALQTLEWETRSSRVIDREVAFALHRLAYEGQVLHTDAWPGAFDEWTVDTLRAVQEAVERILSGQDIRY